MEVENGSTSFGQHKPTASRNQSLLQAMPEAPRRRTRVSWKALEARIPKEECYMLQSK